MGMARPFPLLSPSFSGCDRNSFYCWDRFFSHPLPSTLDLDAVP